MYVVITGASRGIGLALAKIYYSKGYKLILTCEKNIDLLKKEFNEAIELPSDKINGSEKVLIKKGLLSEDDLKNINNVYMLINNAGKCMYEQFQYIEYEKYKEIVYANLDYTFLTTKVIINKMLKNKNGIVVNISSMWGILGASMESIYSMTKAGINALTISLSKEYKESNIDFVAFALGAVDTDMNNKLSIEDKRIMESELDNGRMFTPDEIANIIYDKVSKKEYDTGDIIEINNGLK